MENADAILHLARLRATLQLARLRWMIALLLTAYRKHMARIAIQIWIVMVAVIPFTMIAKILIDLR